MIAGIQSEDVAALILNRVKYGRNYQSERKLALVVEGGAMRGAYSAGSLLGLHLIGASDIFDCAYATSAGAINVAHFLTGVGETKAATYHRGLADGRFFNPYRFPRPADVDFIFDVVLRKEMPLDVALLAKSKTTFKVALLNCEAAVGEMKTVAGVSEQVWDTLKAAIAMPVVYNKRIPLTGGSYVDGGMAIPYPLKAALADGMTDIVVLLSRNPVSAVRPRGLFQYLLWSIFFARWNTGLIGVFERWKDVILELNSLALGTGEMSKGVRILTIAPTVMRLRTSTMNQSLLRDATIEMAEETLGFFGASNEPLKRLIQAGHL